jgi:hypothetical protein
MVRWWTAAMLALVACGGDPVIRPAAHSPAPDHRAVAPDVTPPAPGGYRFEWARSASATECIGAESLSLDTDLILTGFARGTATVGALQAKEVSSSDILFAGFDTATGEARWVRRVATRRNEGLSLVGVAAGGQLVLHLSDFLESHAFRWLDARSGREERSYATAGAMLNNVLLPEGDVIGVTLSGGKGKEPRTVVRFDPAGNVRWKTPLGATQGLGVADTQLDGPELLVLGTLDGQPTFGAGTWQGTRDPGLASAFLARLDVRTGAVKKSTWLFSRKGSESALDIALDERGDLLFVLVAGPMKFLGRLLRSPDKNQLWLVSASRTLDHVNWVTRFATAHPAGARLHPIRGAILVAGLATGDIAIGSSTIRGGKPDPATFVAELGLDGRLRWAAGAVLGRDVREPALATDADGSIYIAGKLDRDTSLGGHPVSPDGHGTCGSIYLAKLAPVRRR